MYLSRQARFDIRPVTVPSPLLLRLHCTSCGFCTRILVANFCSWPRSVLLFREEWRYQGTRNVGAPLRVYEHKLKKWEVRSFCNDCDCWKGLPLGTTAAWFESVCDERV